MTISITFLVVLLFSTTTSNIFCSAFRLSAILSPASSATKLTHQRTHGSNNFEYMSHQQQEQQHGRRRNTMLPISSNDQSDMYPSSSSSPVATKKSLGELLSPSSTCNVNQMSGTDLAYIGDVVFELFIRSRHVWPSKRTSDLQNIVVGVVRAEYQSYLLRKLKENFSMTDKEKNVMARGRNSVTRTKNRRNPAAYQDSTSFEALIGYVYITEPNRCKELLAWLETIIDDKITEL